MRGKLRLATRAAALRVPLAIIVCLGIVLFASGSEASQSERLFQPQQLGLGRGAPARSELLRARDAPSFALAARNGINQLVGLGGQSPVSQEPQSGLWGGHTLPNWWQSALALLTLVRYLERTGNVAPVYQHAILKLYNHNVVRPGTHAPLNFGNEFNDDTGWWGVAWLEAARYELNIRHDLVDASKFLNVAEWDADFIRGQGRRCGGLEWGLGKPPDTITAAEFMSLTAGLAGLREAKGPFHNASRAAHWLGDANWIWGWMRHSGLINLRTGEVLDKLTTSCKAVGGPMTYSEGWTAEALMQLGIARHDPADYRTANVFLRYAVSPKHGLIRDGVLMEKCEILKDNCQNKASKLDIPTYKGLLVDALSDWSALTGSRAYVPVIRAQATAVVNNAILGAGENRCGTAATCLFGIFWLRPKDLVSWALGATVGGQESALDALTSALRPRPKRPL